MSNKKAEQAALTEQENQMERVVMLSRELLLPYFNSKDFTVDFSEWLCENVAVIVNGGAYDLMKKYTVKDLDITSQVKDGYPNKDQFLEFLAVVEEMSMADAINSLQWLAEKMRKTIKEENKDRKFVDLKIEF